MKLKFLILCLSIAIESISGQVGPYPSAGAHSRPPRVRSSNGFTPTNAWFSNWNLNQGANPLQTYPFVVRTGTQGFVICYGGQTITSARNVQTVVNDNWVLSTSETFDAPIIDASTVNADAFELSAKVNFGTKFDVTVVRGSATIVANVRASTPVLKTIHAIVSTSTPGQRSFKVVLNNDQAWLIQSQYPVVWSVNGQEIRAPSVYTGWLKISIVTSIGAEQLLIQTVDSVMTNGKVDYSVDRTAGEVSVKVTYNADSVYFIMPHMTNAYTASSSTDGRGIKGVYRLSRGTGYTYKLPIFKGADPKNAVDTAEKRTQLSAALKDDVQKLGIDPKDPYFGGKALARMANLIEIADLLGDDASKQTALNKVLKELDTYWFVASDPKLVYEPTWGGIVSKSSVGDFGADFGNYVYNDHHFHYGYFAYVASVLARLYPSEYSSRKAYFDPILADYAGTCQYSNLPCRARNKDAFLGFSYAGGLNEFGDSKDQESTSESVNAYLSLRKLAQATKDQSLEDLADYLLSSEIVSCQTYWHITTGSTVYSAPFASNGVVGIVWETKADYTTWFGINTEFIWAIQILPVTDLSPALLTKSWLQQTRNVWRPALDAILPSQGKFADILLLADAIADPTRSGLSDEIHRLSVFDDGNCRTNQLYFFYMVGGSPSSGGGVVTSATSATNSPTSSTTVGPMVDVGRPDERCNPSAGLLGCFNPQDELTGCYNPNTATCFAGGYICPKPTYSCQLACYDPALYNCVNGVLVQKPKH